MGISLRLTGVVLLFHALAAPGFAGILSFTGLFSQDNDVQLLPFTLASANTVTLQTWSYGGGTNVNGALIAAGGFEPVFQLYAAGSGAGLGTFIPGTDSSCPPNTADPGRPLHLCYDLYAQPFLTAGSYILALVQNPNLPVGDNSFSAGFQYDSDPNFNNGFAGTFGQQGDSHWAVDISFQDEVTPIPEPSTGALVAAAALLLVATQARRTRRRNLTCDRQTSG